MKTFPRSSYSLSLPFALRRRRVLATVCLALAGGVHPLASVAQELERGSLAVERVVVTGQLPEPQALSVPDTLVGDTVSREQIDNSNVVNPEDALKYSSNLSVRKRYIGDQNSVVEVRGTNNNQSARTLVLLTASPSPTSWAADIPCHPYEG